MELRPDRQLTGGVSAPVGLHDPPTHLRHAVPVARLVVPFHDLRTSSYPGGAVTISAPHGQQSRLALNLVPAVGADEDHSYLRRQSLQKDSLKGPPLQVVDFFSGCGGLSLGAIEGARRSGRPAQLALAVDHEQDALEVLGATLVDAGRLENYDLEDAAAAVGTPVSLAERRRFGPQGALLLAGPPCQGHSALNNYTRHDDGRNNLYLAVARVAEVARPAAIVVENVRGVGSDRRAAMATCAAHLRKLNYHVVERRLDLHRLGVPQLRVRHVLVATRRRAFQWMLEEAPGRDVRWAIGDLLDRESPGGFNTASRPNSDNQQRIDWLFDNEAFDLPNEHRPVCHQNDHSYRAMYGRLRWDQPAQTITSGYGSMGQGRYVHPERRRTLTPHEAARLQFLPDFVRFDRVTKRGALATMIANVAPPRLSIVLVQALIAQGLL